MPRLLQSYLFIFIVVVHLSLTSIQASKIVHLFHSSLFTPIENNAHFRCLNLNSGHTMTVYAVCVCRYFIRKLWIVCGRVLIVCRMSEWVSHFCGAVNYILLPSFSFWIRMSERNAFGIKEFSFSLSSSTHFDLHNALLSLTAHNIWFTQNETKRRIDIRQFLSLTIYTILKFHLCILGARCANALQTKEGEKVGKR